MKTRHVVGLFCVGALVLVCPLIGAAPIDGTFSYQGRLTDGGTPVTGTADLSFRLYDAAAAGSQVGSTITLLAVPVSGGLFNVELDFGAQRFNGDQRWLEIDARPNLFTPYTTLSPRQPILGTPYAIQTRGLYVSPQLNVGIGTTSPGSLLEVSGDAETEAIYGNHTGATGTAIGTRGQSASTAGRGVYGYATSATGFTFGLYGRSDSADGKGVFGSANAASGTTYGVYGQSLSPGGTGVFGKANTNSGTNFGVYGQTISSAGTGVWGEGLLEGVHGQATASSGTGYGVFGESASSSGRGVFGQATSPSGLTNGGRFEAASTSGRGVVAHATATSGFTYGVVGQSDSPDGFGIYGATTTATGLNYGVYGRSSSFVGYGVYGEASAAAGAMYGVGGRTTGIGGTGVFGLSDAGTGSGVGVGGRSDSPDGYGGYFLGRGYFSGNVGIGLTDPDFPLHVETSDQGTGLFVQNDTGGSSVGVYGVSTGNPGRGVIGQALTGESIGVEGISHVAGGTGVLGRGRVGVEGYANTSSGVIYGVIGRCDSFLGYKFFAEGVGVDYGSSSSSRWKNNIEPIDRPLDKLAQLRGVYFDWDDEHGGHHDVGMIAEEVGAVLPEIVGYEENGVDAVGMDYSKTTPLLVEAVKALRAEKDAEIESLRAEKNAQIAELTRRVSELESLVERGFARADDPE